MDMVWMAHPSLPGQLIYEPVDAVIGLRQSGWDITDAPDPPPAETPPEGLEEPVEDEQTMESESKRGRSAARRGTVDVGKE